MFSRPNSLRTFRPDGHLAVSSFFKLYNPISEPEQTVSVWIKISCSMIASLLSYGTNFLLYPANVLSSGIFLVAVICAVIIFKIPAPILSLFFGLSSLFLIPLGIYLYLTSHLDLAATRVFSLYTVLGISLCFLSQTSLVEIIQGVNSCEKKLFKNHPRYLSAAVMLLMWNVLGLFDHYENYQKAHAARGIKISASKVFPEILSTRIEYTTVQTNALIARGLTENHPSSIEKAPSSVDVVS